jgi:hypothetical protein
MLRIKNKLTILHDNDSVFADHSNDALDFDRDTFTTELTRSKDYLYIGFEKPINCVYVELGTANTNAGEFTAEFYNGTAWTSLSGFHDETKSFTRSGFLRWDRNQTGEASTSVNSLTKYWIRLRPSVTHSSTVIKGVNIVFSDDQDLKREFFEISDFLPSGQSSFVLTHVAARDHIIQTIVNSGEYKRNSSGYREDVTAFDLLDVGQIKMAATYLALSKIFSNVQDDGDDIWRQKSQDYYSLYSQAQKNGFLDIDKDDDGVKDISERASRRSARIVRV